MKTEPSAEMRAMAVMMWQMYTAMVDEGFSEVQALAILSDLLVAALVGKNDNSD
jgi:hypothetical protein